MDKDGVMDKYDIGDIATYSFEDESLGDYYLIIDDYRDNWLVLYLNQNKIHQFLKSNMEILCKKVA